MRIKTMKRLFFVLVLLCFMTININAQRPLKIYISADMEGVVGVVTNRRRLILLVTAVAIEIREIRFFPDQFAIRLAGGRGV